VISVASELLAALEFLGLVRIFPATDAVFFELIGSILYCPIHAHYRRKYQRYLITALEFFLQLLAVRARENLPMQADVAQVQKLKVVI